MKSVCKIISHSDRGRAPAAAGHSPNYNHFITQTIIKRLNYPKL